MHCNMLEYAIIYYSTLDYATLCSLASQVPGVIAGQP